MSLTLKQKELVEDIAKETMSEAMDKFRAELKAEIIPDVVKETLSHMGADPSDLHELQADFLHMRQVRLRADAVKMYGIRAIITGLIAFVGTAVWYFVNNGNGGG